MVPVSSKQWIRVGTWVLDLYLHSSIRKADRTVLAQVWKFLPFTLRFTSGEEQTEACRKVPGDTQPVVLRLQSVPISVGRTDKYSRAATVLQDEAALSTR